MLAAFTLVAAFFTAILPTRRYEVGGGQVVLRCGPFHWAISVGDIQSVAEQDLTYVPLSEGWKLPGYALFSMHSGLPGKVRMCSTSVSRRVLLISTPTATWGITPTAVEEFLRAIEDEKAVAR